MSIRFTIVAVSALFISSLATGVSAEERCNNASLVVIRSGVV